MAADHMSFPDTINPNNFPAKLWRLVNSPSNGAIYWDVSGNIVVIDQRRLETQVLSPLGNSAHNANAFKTSNFSSFVRQLNLYGFRKAEDTGADIHWIKTPKDKGNVHRFHNPNFKRNCPELLVNLRRLTVGNKAKIEAGLEVRCRPPSRLLRFNPGDGGQDTPEKKSGASGLGIPAMGRVRTPAPPQYLVRGHGAAAFLPDKGVAASFHYPSPVSSPFHQATPSNCPGFHPHYAQLGFSSPVCYRPAISSSPFPLGGHHPGPLPPPGYFQVSHPSNKHPQMNCDVNLDTVFKMADEVMETPPTLRLVEVQTPDRPTHNGSQMMMSQGGAGSADEDLKAMLISVVNGNDFLTCSEEEKSVVHIPEQVPEDAIYEMDSDGRWILEAAAAAAAVV